MSDTALKVRQATAADLNARVIGTGTSNAVPVEGVVGGVPVPVSVSADPDGLPAGATSISQYGDTLALAAAGVDTAVVTFTVTALKTGYINKFRLTSEGVAKAILKFGATTKCTLRTSPAQRSVEFEFDPPLSAAAATVITVDITNNDVIATDSETGFDGWEV
jgi:hypothetical protein